MTRTNQVNVAQLLFRNGGRAGGTASPEAALAWTSPEAKVPGEDEPEGEVGGYWLSKQEDHENQQPHGQLRSLGHSCFHTNNCRAFTKYKNKCRTFNAEPKSSRRVGMTSPGLSEEPPRGLAGGP